MIVSLPMYDRAETREANDRLWASVRSVLGRGPDRLSRGNPPWNDWRDPQLLLSQTCGLPFSAGLYGRVRLVGAPHFRLPDCAPGQYFSQIVVHADDPRTNFAEFDGALLALNSRTSQSGWNAALQHAERTGIRLVAGPETGSHAQSAQLVADGLADIATIDAVTWTMIERWDDCAGALKVIGRTPPTPATPYITAMLNEAEPIADALAAGIAALAEADRALLCLDGIVPVTATAYLTVPMPQDIAAD